MAPEKKHREGYPKRCDTCKITLHSPKAEKHHRCGRATTNTDTQ